MWQTMSSANFPRFITVEGGEGAGKTTVIEHIEATLQLWGYSVVKTREPGGTVLGNEIRSWLLNHHDTVKIGAKAELLMFLAARAEHIDDVIAPAVASGKVVLCDRFNDSTIAYQGVGRGLGFDFVRELCLTVCGSTLPDLTFYLDIDPIIGLQRTKRTAKENAAAGEVDRIEAEKIEFHQQVRQAFLKMAKEEPNRLVTIDASQSKKEVAKNCENILAIRFGKVTHHV
jgi:dTMP kinase